ncbi:hypothetical protein MRB53_042330 [Persea americana]|nr:hypothetical protein MRB53_042330 [Persea americana]
MLNGCESSWCAHGSTSLWWRSEAGQSMQRTSLCESDVFVYHFAFPQFDTPCDTIPISYRSCEAISDGQLGSGDTLTISIMA